MSFLRHIISLFLVAAGTLTSAAQRLDYPIQKKVICHNGAVVSAHPLASKAGRDILKKGGNAVDAAIATQLALAVVYPNAGNLGGGGFLVAVLRNGRTIALDYREKAPAAAGRDMYLDSNGKPQMNLSQDGHLAAGVPGTVAGLFASLRYARLPFKTLIQPAIDLAEHGFAITQREADGLNAHRDDFIRLNTVSPEAFLQQGGWKAGDRLVQTDLANTLKRIRDKGQKGFYEGETARLIVEEMRRGRGIIGYDDLKNYTVAQRQAIQFNYKGYQIVTMPLPSSGGIILQQMLMMIADKNIAAKGFQTAESVQLMVEAERRAYADRAFYLGDPDFVKVPAQRLVHPDYIRQRMADYVPGKAGNSKDLKEGVITESEETTHLSVVDKYGNAVSVTTTLNGGYGSRTVVGGAGFLLNNEMDDFSVKPGVPNMYGAVGNEKNAIAPGKRMLSSMTPTIVLKNQLPYIVVGTPGGTTIPTSVYQALVNVLEFGLSPDEAINRPKFHHQWLPDVVFVEKTFNPATRQSLQSMGYQLTERGNIGRTEIIRVTTVKGKRIIEAVGDNRGDDAAEGY